MKLFVIVLCLLSERYLVHALSHSRFHWFSAYTNNALDALRGMSSMVRFALLVIPVVVVVYVFSYLISGWMFGLIYFLFNVTVLYYCLGPDNPFYPVRSSQQSDNEDIEGYLIGVNEQLFSVLFWYIVLGPAGAVGYRLCSISQSIGSIQPPATIVTEWLDWFPTRMTAMLYLLVGNFQSGIKDYIQLFTEQPTNNRNLLRICGKKAVGQAHGSEPSMLQAECMVEHALILFLVVVAVLTFAAWF